MFAFFLRYIQHEIHLFQTSGSSPILKVTHLRICSLSMLQHDEDKLDYRVTLSESTHMKSAALSHLSLEPFSRHYNWNDQQIAKRPCMKDQIEVEDSSKSTRQILTSESFRTLLPMTCSMQQLYICLHHRQQFPSSCTIKTLSKFLRRFQRRICNKTAIMSHQANDVTAHNRETWECVP